MSRNNNNHNNTINVKNRRATFDYEIVETFTAGIVLTGTEIKSIRQGKVGLTDTYCMVINGEVWVKNMYIALFINERGLAKLVIAIARGKKQYDKRQSIKEREDKRAIDRMFKQ